MYRPSTVYHVYNQSNNREVVYKQHADYVDFEHRIRKHLLPFAHILCYCLMPTHFHLMLMPKAISCQPLSEKRPSQQVLHGAFRTLLSGYTQRTNRVYERRGSLFRAKTKYKLAYEGFIPPEIPLPEENPFNTIIPYLRICFRYIHRNPEVAGLVDHPTEWAYGSCPDYASMRENGICDYGLTERLLGIRRM